MAYANFSMIPDSYDYIWIGTNEHENTFMVTARTSKVYYTSVLYWMGGADLGDSNSLDMARDFANCVIEFKGEEKFPYGIRVSEEALQLQARLDDFHDMDEQVDADIEEMVRQNLLNEILPYSHDDWDMYDEYGWGVALS